jgi:hypothetical protein
MNLEVEVNVTTVALGQEIRIDRTGGQGAGTATERATNGQVQVLGFEVVRRLRLKLEAQAADGGQGFARGPGDGLIELKLGHGVRLLEVDGPGPTTRVRDPDPAWPAGGHEGTRDSDTGRSRSTEHPSE